MLALIVWKVSNFFLSLLVIRIVDVLKGNSDLWSRHKAKKYEISIYHQWTIISKFLILTLIFSESLHGNWNDFFRRSLIMLVSNTDLFLIIWPIKCITQLSITRYNLSDDMRRLYERRIFFVGFSYSRKNIYDSDFFIFFFALNFKNWNSWFFRKKSYFFFTRQKLHFFRKITLFCG